MTARRERWYMLLLALLAGLSGLGLHEASHVLDGTSPGGPPSGRLEVHAGDCEHRGDLDHHPPHACLVCKLGSGQGAPLADETLGPAQPEGRRMPQSAPSVDRRTEILHGALGARAPPRSRA